jgi:hypothetical protein
VTNTFSQGSQFFGKNPYFFKATYQSLFLILQVLSQSDDAHWPEHHQIIVDEAERITSGLDALQGEFAALQLDTSGNSETSQQTTPTPSTSTPPSH